MLNVSNKGSVRSTELEVATLNSVIQIVFFFTHQVSPLNAQGHNVSESVVAPLHAADNVYGQRKGATCIVAIHPT